MKVPNINFNFPELYGNTGMQAILKFLSSTCNVSAVVIFAALEANYSSDTGLTSF